MESILHETNQLLKCFAYLILSVAETRDMALSFFEGNEFYDVASRCTPD